MENLEEAIHNIDAFCRVLIEKIIENEKEIEHDGYVEPMENLLKRKYVMEEFLEANPFAKSVIPLPHCEQPLIETFEDDNYVKVLMQCHCRDQTPTIQTYPDGLEICRRECYTNSDGIEICVDKCQKLALPIQNLEVKNMITKCNNNEVFEIAIPKTKNT